MIPGDLVIDTDLLALDVQAATDFGGSSLSTKRLAAVQGWLIPRLEQAGYQPWTHSTRRVFSAAMKSIGGTVTDIGGDLADHEGDALPVSSLVVTPNTDAVYLGLRSPFRGLYVGMADAVNSTAGVASVCYWSGRWSALSSYVDHTAVSSLSFSKAGRITWALPDDWFERSVEGTFGYFVRVQVSSPCAPAALTHMAALAHSRLTYPTARYALGLLYAEGVAGSRGRWQDKADAFMKQATEELERVLPFIRDEFDVDETDTVGETEASSVVATQYLYSWERG